jgi:hypothetical protein
MKYDAIAQLSDQVMALTASMQEFERKQQHIDRDRMSLLLGYIIF